jgi:hypothetical protein
MTNTTKPFPLATVLTVTTGRLCCPISDVYAILNHMTGDNLYTHQLPRAMDECRPWLLRAFPLLGTVDAADLALLDAMLPQADTPDEAVAAWVYMMHERGLPDKYAVSPIPADDHERLDPVSELVAMMGKERVIVVKAKEEEDDNA